MNECLHKLECVQVELCNIRDVIGLVMEHLEQQPGLTETEAAYVLGMEAPRLRATLCLVWDALDRQEKCMDAAVSEGYNWWRRNSCAEE